MPWKSCAPYMRFPDFSFQLIKGMTNSLCRVKSRRVENKGEVQQIICRLPDVSEPLWGEGRKVCWV